MKYLFVVVIKDMRLTVEADFEEKRVLFNGSEAPHSQDWAVFAEANEICNGIDDRDYCVVASNLIHLCSFFDEVSSIDHMDLSIVQRTGITTKSYPSATGLLILLFAIMSASTCRCFGRHRWAWKYYNFTIDSRDVFYFLLSVGFVESLVYDEAFNPEEIKERIFKDMDRINEFNNNLLEFIRSRTKGYDADINALSSVTALTQTLFIKYEKLLLELREDIIAAHEGKTRPEVQPG